MDPDPYRRFARAAAPAYGFGDATITLLSISENATFLLTEGDRRLVLRIHRDGYHPLPAIRSELAWIDDLRRVAAVRTPALVPTTTGESVTAVTSCGATRFVSAFEFIDGVIAEERPADIGYDDLGEITARLHAHACGWDRPEWFERFRWDADTMLGPQARWGDWRSAPNMNRSLRERITPAAEQAVTALHRYGTAPDRFGLVHADLRLANLMVGSDTVDTITVIDFDDCGWSWFLTDLGSVVSWMEDSAEVDAIIAAWLDGYRRVRDLGEEHRAMIPTFVMVRRLMLTAWIGTHPEAEIAQQVSGHFASGTAELADRYLHDPAWLADACGMTPAPSRTT